MDVLLYCCRLGERSLIVKEADILTKAMNQNRKEQVTAGKELETHSLFPSGEWEGFYAYEFGPNARRHLMSFTLEFKNGAVTGGGIDDIGAFTWRGHYDTEQLRCQLYKRYVTHLIFYDGYVDENGIWGSWQIPLRIRGGFHLWPKGISEDMTVGHKEETPEYLKIPELLTV